MTNVSKLTACDILADVMTAAHTAGCLHRPFAGNSKADEKRFFKYMRLAADAAIALAAYQSPIADSGTVSNDEASKQMQTNSYLIGSAELREKGITFSRQHLTRLIRAGKFPKAVSCSGTAKSGRHMWVETEIDKYIAERIAERDSRESTVR